jgi:hypothetical protein
MGKMVEGEALEAMIAGVGDVPGCVDVRVATALVDVLQNAIAHSEDIDAEYPDRPKIDDCWPEVARKRWEAEGLASLSVGAAWALRWLAQWTPEEEFLYQRGACGTALSQLVDEAGKKKPAWTGVKAGELIRMLDGVIDRRLVVPDKSYLLGIARALADEGVARGQPAEARACLPKVAKRMQSFLFDKSQRVLLAGVERAMDMGGGAVVFEYGFGWSVEANGILAGLEPGLREVVVRAIRHASLHGSVRVSKEWLKVSREIAAAGAAKEGREFQRVLGEMMRAAQREVPLRRLHDMSPASPAQQRSDHSSAMWSDEPRAIGMALFCGAMGDEAVQKEVGGAIEAAARLKPGPRKESEKFVLACVQGLAVGEKPAVGVLNQLVYRVKWPAVHRALVKAAAEAGKRVGLSPVDAEETGVGDCGLVGGRCVVKLAGGQAEIAVGAGGVEVVWRKADGEVARTSAGHKKADAAGVAAVMGRVKEIEAAVSAQRLRLELLYREDRRWKLEQWRQRYIDHGLMGAIAGRLIWEVDGTAAIWMEGGLRDVAGRLLEAGKTAEVRLWHPVGRPVKEVLAWRKRLEELEITQPFKQAHREVYLLTEAELRTGTYSNRFAGHIVKAGGMLALGQVRRWKVGAYGMSTLELPKVGEGGMKAEYWSEGAGDETTPMGGPVYLATDQVRFYQAGATEPVPLEGVPPLAFSEVMRDVDLFVGVCSVANDPTWGDRGAEAVPGQQFHRYWHDISFGDLNATAQTRREVLAKLLPRLGKLAGKWELTDKFLRVQGKLRGYKIHLGSSNILMEPNDQYLCIVPARNVQRPAGLGYVPFEGDERMSVILSKALLLVEDEGITDVTIVRQIR